MAEIIDVVFENGVFKPLKKIKTKEGDVIEIRLKKVSEILRETSGMFHGKYDRKLRYEIYDIR